MWGKGHFTASFSKNTDFKKIEFPMKAFFSRPEWGINSVNYGYLLVIIINY